MSIMVGTGRGATAGILIKNAKALEIMEKVDTLVVDKTGTLTEGKPKLIAVEIVNGFLKEDILCFAASLERASEHPLAAAIVKCAEEQGLTLMRVADFQSLTGQGATGQFKGQNIVLGNAQLMVESGIATDLLLLTDSIDTLRKQGQTVMMIAIDGKAAGLLGVADPIKKIPFSAFYCRR